ncbi:hypothetical protein ScPMuIL_004346 [Solemya velum]
MAVALIIAVTFAILAITVWLFGSRNYRRIINKIPGPPTFPVLGNAHQLMGTEKEFFNTVIRFCTDFSEYGMLRFWLASRPLVAIYQANLVEKILGSTKHISKSPEYDFLHPWLRTGLLTSTGAKWRTRRKMLTPAFHFRILNDFVSVFNEQAAVMLKNLEKQMNGDTIDIFPFITMCALDIICESAMGKHVNAQGNAESTYVQAVHKITVLVQQRMRSPWLWPDALFYLIGDGREADKCLSVLHGFTKKVIKEKKDEFAKNRAENPDKSADETVAGGKKRLAFLDMLLCYADDGGDLAFEDIQEEVDTFMFEGHDTTAAAMSWAIHCIGADQNVQKKLQEEMDEIFGTSDRQASMEDLKRMKYLECVIKEALRLFPSVPIIGRVLAEDDQIGNYHIPAKTTVMVIPKMLHMDAQYFPDPEKFDPDRFTTENSARRHPYCYVPFSAGLRNCIGQKFALLEEKTVLSSILRKYNILSTQTREELSPIGELILRPENGIHIRLTTR